MKKATETSFILLSQVSELWQDEIKTELDKYNLTNAEFVVLSSLLWLTEQQEQVTQVNVCTYSNTKPMNTSIVLRKIQNRKFIQRKEHPVDTRAKLINLTAEGTKVTNEIVQKIEAINARFFGVSAKEVADFTKKLKDIRDAKKK
jgi:DNA-binding MarR family transcriptional regulator